MHGVKVAAAIVGASVFSAGLVAALVYGMVALLGDLWGGIAALAIIAAVMFAVIAIEENR